MSGAGRKNPKKTQPTGKWANLNLIAGAESGRLRSIRKNPDLSLSTTKRKEFKPNLSNIPARPKTVPIKLKPEPKFTKEAVPKRAATRARQKQPSALKAQKATFSARSTGASGEKRKAKHSDIKHEESRPKTKSASHREPVFDLNDPLAPLSVPWMDPAPELNDKPFEDLADNSLFYMQMPTQLPQDTTTHSLLPDEPSISTHGNAQEFQSTIVGEHMHGYLGKMVVFESGKVALQIGDVSFEVTQGQPLNFLQEVYSIDDEEGQCVKLGNLTQRLMCIPDIEKILGVNIEDIHVQGGLPLPDT